MSEISDLTKKVLEFRNKRKWKHFHTPKDMAISLALEAAEVLEHFQWKNEEEIKEYLENYREHIGEELSDVLWWVLLMSHDLKIDIKRAFLKKIAKNKRKYPLEKSKGKNLKWNRL